VRDNQLAQDLLNDASRCRRMAEDATSPEARQEFTAMAEHYENALANLLGAADTKPKP